MLAMTQTAERFFKACETGGGWADCAQYCTGDASFSAQAEPLSGIHTLQGYTEWMKGLLTLMPDGRYEVRSFATDEQRANVCAFGVFTGTHTAEGGPVPPTGRTTATDYVYVMDFQDGRIRHMTKIWNAPWALGQLGWT